jgi:poly-gamma-glutamate capsule biosynthesis protein CapA/YwtB (metallophosphatase superfamily)
MLFASLLVVMATGDASIRINAVGDIQMGRAWPDDHIRLPPDDAVGFFAGVAEVLQQGDLTVGNLETVIADRGESHKCERHRPPCYAYRVPTAFATRLAEAGFDALSLANNHAGDFGMPGVKSTMAALDAAGVHYSGPFETVAFSEIGGRRVAFVAFGFGKHDYTLRDVRAARRVVRELSQSGALVIVSFHGGAEGLKARRVPAGVERYRGEFRGNLRFFAHAVVDAGADLVMGHGPHVLRGVEIYRDRLIAYSLGNFSSYRSLNVSRAMGVSCILKVSLASSGALVSADIVSVRLPRPGMPVLDPDARAVQFVRALSRKDFGDPVFDDVGHYGRSVLADLR